MRCRFVHNINPDPSNIKMHSTNSSLGRKALAFHIENPYAQKSEEEGQPGTPDGLILIGVRPDEIARTSVLPVAELIDRLPASIVKDMRDPEFLIRSGASFKIPEIMETPLIAPSGVENRERFRLLTQKVGPNRLVPLTKEAEHVINVVESTLDKIVQEGGVTSVSLKAGEAIIFNNGSFPKGNVGGVMHAREGYISNPDKLLKCGLTYLKQED